MALLATLAVVSGAIITLHRASARRCVGSFGVTSTMRAPPSGSRCVRLRSTTARSLGAGPPATAWHSGRPRVLTRTVDLARRGDECQTAAPAGHGREKGGHAHLRVRVRGVREHLEVVQSFTRRPADEVPGVRRPLRKVFGAVGIVFKGSGFYKTDSRHRRRSPARARPRQTAASRSSDDVARRRRKASDPRARRSSRGLRRQVGIGPTKPVRRDESSTRSGRPASFEQFRRAASGRRSR